MLNNKQKRTRVIRLTPPSLEDNTADGDRLAAALKKELETDAVEIGLPVLKRLPDLLRRGGHEIQCVMVKDRRRWTVAGVKAAGDPSPSTGLAVDLGTTMISMRLTDMDKQTDLAEISFGNPQAGTGADVLTRIHFAGRDDGLKQMKAMLIERLNEKIVEICRMAGANPDGVHMVAVAGNTVMTHFFMGLDPRWIIREPYIPVINRPETLMARDLGIQINESARCLIFPNIGSYFGGDLIAGILFSGLARREKPAILVDIGTNAEVVMGNREWLMACAGAAGPALEGGVTRMGMAAGPGVIDHVRIDPDAPPGHGDLTLHTIGDLKPEGICGSGLIDLAAGLFLSGKIDIQGKFRKEKCKNRLQEKDGVPRFVVASAEESGTGKALFITQADLDSLIRSKAAMHTILETLSHTVGVGLSELETFFVAGAFGVFINPQSAISIGMIPDLPLERYQAIGNSSLGGAALALKSHDALEEIDAIRDSIAYMELNVNQDFMNRFSAARFLPHTDRSLFPSVSERA
ncbi:(Fe-S)-binding protein [Candidatus Desulfarcum epimagneticum]|uniref:(Fe-S)-binding protein n=1 Tax=uncultured Desulfobacteraceae bacterium TaxID=218296 RepID=A0A484HEL0_9BACT|nr:(Fe-S)-binding protein [uncultured Desulfobacteraceae bacterium]